MHDSQDAAQNLEELETSEFEVKLLAAKRFSGCHADVDPVCSLAVGQAYAKVQARGCSERDPGAFTAQKPRHFLWSKDIIQ